MTKVGVVVGVVLMLLGIGSNQLVYRLNGAMPFHANAWVEPPVAFEGRIPIWHGTKLVALADIIPTPIDSVGYVSPGDTARVVGAIVFLLSAILYLYHGRSGRVRGKSVRLSA